jgi:succinate dehydrogenase / fumarate reductase, iron-sulfur subunit
MNKTFIVKIYRGVQGKQFWEEFEIELRPNMNVISALMDIQRNPINRKEEKVTPVAYESGCLEEVCGSCSMLINGKPRQACTALVQPILDASGSQVITLAPFSKFPLVRDLHVNRGSMFDNLKKVHAWIDAEDSFDRGFGPRISPNVQEVAYVLSTCMTCGCCSESCPQVNASSPFMGPAPISQVRLFNFHPIGSMNAAERTHAIMKDDGIRGCSNAQNCVAVCPKEIPLTESLAVMQREAGKQAVRDFFSVPDVDSN